MGELYLDILDSHPNSTLKMACNGGPQAHIVGEYASKMITDVWLDFFLSCRNLVVQLNCGDELLVDGDCCRNLKGERVLRFSKQFMMQLEAMKQNNYVPKTAKIRFIVYWKRENLDYEIRIVLPELYLES